ncbi:MAG: hypothetical protein Q7S95_02830 [bacterium]|nr:hypothetical protein [bacterium]
MAELSFERMFALRALTLGVYMVAFYVLTDIAKVQAIPALCIIVAVSAWTAITALRWRDKDDWFHVALETLLLGVLLCGTMPYILTNDQREPNAPAWAGFPFILCGAETVFFLSALGMLGSTLADPIWAILGGLIVLAFQTSILAIGFQFFSRPVVKNR